MENQSDNLNATTPNPNPIPTSEPASTDTSASGGIFSGSDTRIETENLPTIQPSPMSTAPNGAITPSLRTESTVTGDLKLGGTTKKKKWPFVVLGVAAVAVIAIVAGLLLQGAENGKAESIEEAFGHFANYYLFGEDSSRLLEGEWDRDRLYTAEEAVLSKDKDFFQQAKTYFDEYKSLYDEQIAQQEDVSSTDTSFVEAYADAINFLYLYSQTDFFDDAELLQLYLSSGAATAYEVINDRYRALADTEYQTQKDFAEGRILYDSAQIDRWSIYSQSGCLKDDGSFVDNDSCKINLSDFDVARIEESYDIPDLPIIPQDVAHETTRMLYIMANQGFYK